MNNQHPLFFNMGLPEIVVDGVKITRLKKCKGNTPWCHVIIMPCMAQMKGRDKNGKKYKPYKSTRMVCVIEDYEL